MDRGDEMMMHFMQEDAFQSTGYEFHVPQSPNLIKIAKKAKN
jgi:hypothetical protein